jgi:tetratricopeptide (TPR) repeat protein
MEILMKNWLNSLILALVLLGSPLQRTLLAAEMADVGSLSFPTSAAAEPQAHFLRGVGILHSFGWKQAIQQFQAAQMLDPDFAMAYWGEALSYNHPLLREQDLETPRAVLERLAPSLEARLAKAPTLREKGFLTAVDALFFGAGDYAQRRTAYMQSMRNLHEQYPADDEVAAFYALSLLSAAGPAGSDAVALNVLGGAIALEISARNPQHPGAVHYTIHAFDDPTHARLALPAARVFADIAGAVSHAQHMPTHIFIQLGMWEQVSTSNQAAYDVAVNLWEPGDVAGDMVHALDWGQYGDLQRGDYGRAKLWIERMVGIAERNPGQARVQNALPRVRARLVLESRQWQTLPVTDKSSAVELLATGVSAVKLNRLGLAAEAAERLQKMAAAVSADKDTSYYSRSSQPLQIMHKEVAGMLALAQGKTESGLKLLAEGVAIAEAMRPPNGAPNPVKPVHELYAEALFDAEHPADAIVAYHKSLQRTPNRPLSLLGLARSYVATGDRQAGRAQYRKLAEVWKNTDFPALQEAEQYLASENVRVD